MRGTCCSFHGSIPAFYLLALGLTFPLLSLYEDKSPGQAKGFASRLRSTLREVCRTINADTAERVNRRGEIAPGELVGNVTITIPNVLWTFELSEAYRTIEAVAAWHEKIGKLGYGVHARF